MEHHYLDVRSILEIVGGYIGVTEDLELDDLTVGDVTFTMRGPAHVDLGVSNAGEGIVAHGTVVAPVVATCVRCLCDFETELSGDVDGFYLRPGDVIPEGSEDEYTGAVDDAERIDLLPALLAALVLEAPFAPLHDEECAGLCIECGADLNVEQCGCDSKPDASHPFAALEGLLTDVGKDESPS